MLRQEAEAGCRMQDAGWRRQAQERKENKRNLDSFFEPKKKKRPIFNQLAVGTDQIHEDFLLADL